MMLSALSIALQKAESNLLLFIDRVSSRSGLSKESLLLLWEEVNSLQNTIPPVVEVPKVASQPAVVEVPKPVSPPVVEEPKPVIQPVVVEAPKPVSPPVVEAPKVASLPVVVEAPKPVSPPVVEVPKVVSQPVVVEAPKVANKPAVVEAPKVASQPVVEAQKVVSKPAELQSSQKSFKITVDDSDSEEEKSIKPKQTDPQKPISKKMAIEEDSDEETEVRARCRHIMVSGKSKGAPCGAPAKENGLCNKHKSSTTATKKPENSVPKQQEKAPVEVVNEFVKLTSREEEKRIEFRVKTREIILNKTYPPVPAVAYKNYTIVENTKVVLNDEKTAIIGYLDEKEQLVRLPTQATDKVVLEYGIPFDASHINDSDIDD